MVPLIYLPEGRKLCESSEGHAHGRVTQLNVALCSRKIVGPVCFGSLRQNCRIQVSGYEYSIKSFGQEGLLCPFS